MPDPSPKAVDPQISPFCHPKPKERSPQEMSAFLYHSPLIPKNKKSLVTPLTLTDFLYP